VGEKRADKLLVVAYVIRRCESRRGRAARLRQGALASYKAPKVVYLARDFPRTKNGKILRREITPGLATGRSGA
jgi:acyl-coenzyme A synthetase/AMP-(fatty) acid ligase